ncbi:MAG: ArsR family transcriptional regulator [Methanomassiliicoccales archaeon]|nr:MAG: ArsR family transcriptional regulator [Methanomassiliicoccales archaeon]
MAAKKSSDFDVYSTSTGLRQISNPVRQKILSELQRHDLSLSEIASLTGKAQSTLSVHLDKMVSEGLIGYRDDPQDNRRKIFYLISRPVGSSVVPREELKRAIGNTIARSIGLPSTFLKGTIRSIVIGMESIGFNMDPILKDIGKQIGMEVSKRFKSENVEGLIQEVKEFYKEHELGEVVVYSIHPVTLIIKDEYDCSKAPDVGRTLCLLNEGMLEAIFEVKLGMPLRVAEKETFGSNFNMCKYVIEPSL